MSITFRNYEHPADFSNLGEFLIKHHQPGNLDWNWLQPAWEYMHSHPFLDDTALHKIGIWEDSGVIVGAAHYESKLGEVFFEIDPHHAHLKPVMLDYAEPNLYGMNDQGERFLQVFVNDHDLDFEVVVQARGYHRVWDCDRPMYMLEIPGVFPEIRPPDGFRLKSLQDENNLHKINRVLWRGFNHPGEAPEEDIQGRKRMQSVPNFRPDLNIVVEAQDGNFVAYAGTWYEQTNHFAYVEPVATDPDFRRLGLGKAAVVEGIQRCKKLGATAAYVGSDLEFYQAVGFKKIFTSNCWEKRFP